MTPTPAAAPPPVRSLDDARAVDASATRHEVPGEHGPMVWRSWGSGVPLVLLHGGSGSWNHWVRNVLPLAALGRQVWVPDLPGFGESAPPPAAGHDADALPDPVGQAARHLLGDTPCDVVGFSFGSIVGSLWAASAPEHVKSLVIVGAAGFGFMSRLRAPMRAWRHLPDGPEKESTIRHNLWALMLARPESIDALSIGLHTENLHRDRMEKRRLASTNILTRTLPRLQCPVAGIWGGQDALYVGREHDRDAAYTAATGRQPHIIGGAAGHWVQFEAADEFNVLLATLLGGGMT